MSSQLFIPASEARGAIEKVIRKGGYAGVTVGDEFRCLRHFPSLDRPARRLPWPFSEMQPFRFAMTRQTFAPRQIAAGVQFSLGDPRGPLIETEYNKSQIEEAIDAFLDGSKPNDGVSITINSRL